MAQITAIILAAGQGTRMKSTRAKVLFELCGRTMVSHVLEATFSAGVNDAVVVVGHQADSVKAALAAYEGRVRTALQAEQKGTGHAVVCALGELPEGSEIALVLCGDTPLLRGEDLAKLIAGLNAHPEAQLSMLTCQVEDPTGYGRIVRNADGAITAIVEHRDADETIRAVREINPAMYAVRVPFLKAALGALKPNNAQGEYYFTDVVAIAAKERGVVGVTSNDPTSLGGINDRVQLEVAERELYQRIADRFRREGVSVRGNARIDASVRIEPEAVIEDAVVLRGQTTVGAGAMIDVGSVLTNVSVAAGAKLKPYTVATQSTIGERAEIGPFSHLRPDSVIGETAHVGNFVETKKTTLHKGAKANHLAYLGDGEIGEGANVGAGTIFCNYDGFKKHKTDIGKGAFIGSDSQLVAPIRIGDNAYVATGTTVTRDVPDGALAISRVKQENKEGYAERLKARLKSRT
jgi:bifunctional UDP-N-acetylglucosamine pyrophosphorylase/glucosamine-1-phosphate N-acetyltransferase